MATLEDDARQRRQQLRIALAGLQQSAQNSRRSARQSERNSLRSAGIDPNTGRPIPGGRLDPKAQARSKAKGGPTGAQYLNWQTSIEEIASAARRYKGKMSRAQIVEKLSAGRPAQQVLTATRPYGRYKKGDPLPQGLTPQEKKALGARNISLGAINPYPADLRMSAALDIALFGHLTPATQRRLHRAGFNLKRLGLRTYGQYRSSLRNNATEQGIRAGRLAGPPA